MRLYITEQREALEIRRGELDKAHAKIVELMAGGGDRPIWVHRLPRRALTLCPQLCMGIPSDARFPAWSADALPATLYGHLTQAM